MIEFKGEITYDAKGRVIVEENRMRALFNTAARTAYTYNDKGFEATKVIEDLDSKEETNIYYEYQYDAYGSAIEVKEYKNGNLKVLPNARLNIINENRGAGVRWQGVLCFSKVLNCPCGSHLY